MQYTDYHLHQKAHNICSPSQQLQFPTHVACYRLCNWHRAVASVDSCKVKFFKTIFQFNFIRQIIVYTFLCVTFMSHYM